MRGIICLSVGLFIAADCVVAEEWNVAQVRGAIRARNTQLGNLIVQYEITNTYAAPKPVARREGKRVMVTEGGVGQEVREFSVLGKLSRYEIRPVAPKEQSQLIPAKAQSIYVYSPERAERLTLSQDGHPLTGTIDDRLALPPADIEAGLCLRAVGAQDRLNLTATDSYDLEPGTDGRIVMKGQRGRRIRDQWVVDPALGYAARSYRRVISDDGGADVEIIADDFRNVNGVTLPYLLTLKRNHVAADGNTSTWVTSKILVKEYKVGSPENTPDRFQMKWPEGTTVIDKRSRLVFSVRNGQRVLDDQRIYEETVKHIEKKMREPFPSTARSSAGLPPVEERASPVPTVIAPAVSLTAKCAWIVVIAALVLAGVFAWLAWLAWRRRKAPGNIGPPGDELSD